MPAAANIDEAIAFLPENVIAKRQAVALLASMNLWLIIFSTTAFPGPGTALDPANLDDRSVRDWFGPSLLVRDAINEATLGAQQISANEIMDIVNRALNATKFAQDGARITANQETSIVAQYNTAWA